MKEIPVLYKRKEECCGCTACYAICPIEAISMVEDEEGFEYPQIDESTHAIIHIGSHIINAPEIGNCQVRHVLDAAACHTCFKVAGLDVGKDVQLLNLSKNLSSSLSSDLGQTPQMLNTLLPSIIPFG